MKYTPEMIERFGLVPYAVYGGYVASFKCPAATGDRIYDAALIGPIFAAAQRKADAEIERRNAETRAAIKATLDGA